MIEITEKRAEESTKVKRALTTHIDNHKPIPAGDNTAALRLLALFGTCPTIFGGTGEDASLPRAATQWAVRLPDDTYGSLCHLMTLDPKLRTMVRILVSALSSKLELV